MSMEIGALEQILEFLKKRQIDKLSPKQDPMAAAPALEEKPEEGQEPGAVQDDLAASGDLENTEKPEGGDDEELKKLMDLYSSME